MFILHADLRRQKYVLLYYMNFDVIVRKPNVVSKFYITLFYKMKSNRRRRRRDKNVTKKVGGRYREIISNDIISGKVVNGYKFIRYIYGCNAQYEKRCLEECSVIELKSVLPNEDKDHKYSGEIGNYKLTYSIDSINEIRYCYLYIDKNNRIIGYLGNNDKFIIFSNDQEDEKTKSSHEVSPVPTDNSNFPNDKNDDHDEDYDSQTKQSNHAVSEMKQFLRINNVNSTLSPESKKTAEELITTVDENFKNSKTASRSIEQFFINNKFNEKNKLTQLDFVEPVIFNSESKSFSLNEFENLIYSYPPIFQIIFLGGTGDLVTLIKKNYWLGINKEVLNTPQLLHEHIFKHTIEYHIKGKMNAITLAIYFRKSEILDILLICLKNTYTPEMVNKYLMDPYNVSSTLTNEFTSKFTSNVLFYFLYTERTKPNDNFSTLSTLKGIVACLQSNKEDPKLDRDTQFDEMVKHIDTEMRKKYFQRSDRRIMHAMYDVAISAGFYDKLKNKELLDKSFIWRDFHNLTKSFRPGKGGKKISRGKTKKNKK